MAKARSCNICKRLFVGKGGWCLGCRKALKQAYKDVKKKRKK